MTPEVTTLNHRAPTRLSIGLTLSPPSDESSEMRKWNVAMYYTEYHQPGSFADPNIISGYVRLSWEVINACLIIIYSIDCMLHVTGNPLFI